MKKILLIFILSLHLNASGVAVFVEKDRVSNDLFYDYLQVKSEDSFSSDDGGMTHKESAFKYTNSKPASQFTWLISEKSKVGSEFDYFSSAKYSSDLIFCNKTGSVKKGVYFYSCFYMKNNSLNEENLLLVKNSSKEKASDYQKFKPLASGFSLLLKDYEKLDVNYIMDTVNVPYKEIANQLFKSATDMLAVKYTIVLNP